MELTSLQALADCTRGRLHFSCSGDASRLVSGITTDSRKATQGDLYVALRGQQFDGHSFVKAASLGGASAALVDAHYFQKIDPFREVPTEFAWIIVDDTLRAYQNIAAWHRQRVAGLEVIGITGSNGKTTTKDFVAAALDPYYPVVKTEGNFNNHIGVPHTLLRLNNTHAVAVVELGINHPGEMAPLVRMSAPTSAIVTSIGSAHLEFMGSKEVTAWEKGELLEKLPADGLAILNSDDEFCDSMRRRTRAATLAVGRRRSHLRVENELSITAGTTFTVASEFGEVATAVLRFPGKHIVTNALLAIALGKAFNLSLHECVAALKNVALTGGRVEVKKIRHVTFLDDSYNANPESMLASIDALRQLPLPEGGRRIAVLGVMGELGQAAEAGYRQVGEAAGAAGLDILITVGGAARAIDASAISFGVGTVLNLPSNEEASAYLTEIARSGDAVLLKGSRSAHMEHILHWFDASAANANSIQAMTHQEWN